MNSTDSIESFTASQLTQARAADFTRFLALQTQFSGDPNAVHITLREFKHQYSRSLNLHLFEKAAVSVGTTLDSTYAGPLAPLRQLSDAFLELLRPETLIGRIPGLRRVPFLVTVSAQTTGGSYTWLGEGAATPATKSDFSTVSLGRAKAGGLIIVTRELAELSTPSAVTVLQGELIQGSKQFLDSQFCDPAIAPVANVSPGSITNGAASSASTGSSQAAAATDFQILTNAFLAANPGVEHMVILMSPSNAVAMSRALNQSTFGLRGGQAFGIPIVTSGSVGARLIALDASQILIADEGDVEASASNSALVQMDSVPSEPTAASTVLLSLFQRDLTGFRIVRLINWVRARTTAVYYISSATYVS